MSNKHRRSRSLSNSVNIEENTLILLSVNYAMHYRTKTRSGLIGLLYIISWVRLGFLRGDL